MCQYFTGLGFVGVYRMMMPYNYRELASKDSLSKSVSIEVLKIALIMCMENLGEKQHQQKGEMKLVKALERGNSWMTDN